MDHQLEGFPSLSSSSRLSPNDSTKVGTIGLTLRISSDASSVVQLNPSVTTEVLSAGLQLLKIPSIVSALTEGDWFIQSRVCSFSI